MTEADNGHGTHVAGIAGGNGMNSNGKYMGIAPECNLISVKVLNGEGKGNAGETGIIGLNKKTLSFQVFD